MFSVCLDAASNSFSYYDSDASVEESKPKKIFDTPKKTRQNQIGSVIAPEENKEKDPKNLRRKIDKVMQLSKK